MANSQRMTGVIVKTNDNAFVSYKEYRWDFDLLKWKFWLQLIDFGEVLMVLGIWVWEWSLSTKLQLLHITGRRSAVSSFVPVMFLFSFDRMRLILLTQCESWKGESDPRDASILGRSQVKMTTRSDSAVSISCISFFFSGFMSVHLYLFVLYIDLTIIVYCF